VARIGPAALGETLLYRLAEDHALVTDESPGACDPNSAIRNPQSAIHVTDVTSVLAAFCLAGPRSRGLLSKVTSLNLTDRALPPFSCAQAQVAKCHAILARLDAGGMPAYRLFVTRDYAEFVWEALMEAGRDCGVVPVGTEAWRSIGVQERGDSSEPAPDSQR
jgi:heterotetrameric sarcosine oxidase gamma subunit